jgi:hypothetical protein
MKVKIKWILAVGGFFVILIVSMIAPVAADAWTDRNTVEELSYETVVYEPYEIDSYLTFEDKLDAIAGGLEDGTPLVITLEERQEALDDETLIQLANEELYALYQNGILPQKYEIAQWEERKLMELYVLPQSEEDVPLQDVFFWTLTGVVDDTLLTFCMDCSFHKIYYLSFRQEGDNVPRKTQEWEKEVQQSDGKTLAEGWCSYWELDDAVIEDASGEEQSIQETDSYALSIVDDDQACNYYVQSKNHHEIGLVYRMEDYLAYGMPGICTLVTGMQGLMMHSGYN